MTTEFACNSNVNEESRESYINNYSEESSSIQVIDTDHIDPLLSSRDTEDEPIEYSSEDEDACKRSANVKKCDHKKGIWLKVKIWQKITIPLLLFGSSCINNINIVLNMIDLAINLVFECISRYLGISGQWRNVKIMRQLFIIGLLVLVFVQSRKDESTMFNSTRLFPEYSLVSDYPYGELSLLERDVQNSEMTVVLYYAPWDRDSQNFIPHFINVAQYYHKQVTFSAINCWYPKGECRQNYNIYSYPMVVLFLKSNFKSSYQLISYGGPMSSHHLIRFIRNALQPYTHIVDKQELSNMLIQHQALLVAYYSSESSIRENMSFYFASIKKLQHEELSDVKYTLLTDSSLALSLGLNAPSDLQLRTKEKVIVFPRDAEKNSKNITNFVGSNLPRLWQLVHISGKKSLALNNIIKQGPTLIVFTPDNPYYNYNELFELMKLLSLEYYSCKPESARFWSRSSAYKKLRKDLSHWQEDCQNYLYKTHWSKSDTSPESLSETQHGDICEPPNFSKMFKFNPPQLSESFSWNDMWEVIQTDGLMFSNSGFCSNKRESLWKNSSNTSTLFQKRTIDDSMGGPVLDDMIKRLVEEKRKNSCKRLTLGMSLSQPLFVSEGSSVVDIGGLGCYRNRTLQFAAVDSLLHGDLAQEYGVKFMDSTKTGCVIIDREKEVSYTLEQCSSRSSLTNFIYNFTHNLLDRKVRKWNASNENSNNEEGLSYLEDFDADSYVRMMSEIGQAYLVVHYTRHCGACSSIGDVLLQCKKILSGSVSDLKFARIDVSKNTLPWHLTFEFVPILILYPRLKKSETKVFNSSLPLTVRNLMSFISSTLNKNEQDSLKRKLCDTKCRKALAAQGLLKRVKYYVKLQSLKSKLIYYQENVEDDLKVGKERVFYSKVSRFYQRIFIVQDKLRYVERTMRTYGILR